MTGSLSRYTRHIFLAISLLPVSSIGGKELNVQREIGLGGAATLRSLTAGPVNRTLLTAVATLQEEEPPGELGKIKTKFARQGSQLDGDRRDRWFMISSFCLAF